MAMHNVLKRYWHAMVGVDFHLDIMPAVPPVPNPVHCHFVGHVLQGWFLATWADNVKAENVEIIQMGSDIANGIPHIPIPPSHFLLALVMTAASGSKSHFGPSTVVTAKGPVGAALIIAVNLNLNCGCPCPTPTGVVIAPNTVEVRMTFGDILGGFFAMYVDACLATILNLATAGFGKWAGAQGALIQFLLGSPLGKSSADVVKWIFGEDSTITTVLTHLPGAPFGWVGTWGGHASDGARSVGQSIGDGVASVFGSDGAAANEAAPSAIEQSANPSPAANPASGVTDNPGVEEF